jgi:UDP-N-acetylmuramoylalanine--D-glutamate ligase
VEHRLELFLEKDGVRYYNDSAATLPEAAAAAVRALPGCILVAGGTDKELDMAPLADAASLARKIILLAGTATDKLIPGLVSRGLSFEGPFDALDKAAQRAVECAAAQRAASECTASKCAASECAASECAASFADTGGAVLLSPGAASFGMFLNEFDRGNRWKQAIIELTE